MGSIVWFVFFEPVNRNAKQKRTAQSTEIFSLGERTYTSYEKVTSSLDICWIWN